MLTLFIYWPGRTDKQINQRTQVNGQPTCTGPPEQGISKLEKTNKQKQYIQTKTGNGKKNLLVAPQHLDTPSGFCLVPCGWSAMRGRGSTTLQRHRAGHPSPPMFPSQSRQRVTAFGMARWQFQHIRPPLGSKQASIITLPQGNCSPKNTLPKNVDRGEYPSDCPEDFLRMYFSEGN